MNDSVLRERLRQAHASATHGAQAIVTAMACHEPQFLSATLDEINGAAARFELAARQLRDAAVLARAEKPSV